MMNNTKIINKVTQFIHDNDPDPQALKQELDKLPEGIILEPGKIDDYFGQLLFLEEKSGDYLALPVLADKFWLITMYITNHYTEIDPIYQSAIHFEFFYIRAMLYATSDLEKIKSVIEKNLNILVGNLRHNGTVSEIHYLLINPRKEVVEWALNNSEKLRIKECIDCNGWEKFETFIREHQSNQELVELVLNSLK